MTADSTPSQQGAPLNPFAVRDRLHRLFSLLGVGVHVGVTQLGSQHVVTFSSMWVGDAGKLAEALERVSEVKPYLTMEGATRP